MCSTVAKFVQVVLAWWLLFERGSHVKADDLTETVPCTLCFDGSRSPLPDENAAFTEAQLTFPLVSELFLNANTCSEVEQYLANNNVFALESESCQQVQSVGALRCGCPAVPFDKEASSCSLCMDGSQPPEELLDVVVKDKFFSSVVTCRDLHAQASLPFLTGFVCDESQWLGYKFCGCPRPSSVDLPICDLDCDIPESIWEDTAITNAWRSEGAPKVDWTCGDVDAFTRMTSSKKGCAILASAANGGCGCPVPTQELGEAIGCSVCPNVDNGMPFASTLNKDVPFGFTCFNALYIASTTCDDLIVFGRSREEVCCPHNCKEDKAGKSVNVIFRHGRDEKMTCADVRAAGEKGKQSKKVFCENLSEVQKKCGDTCRSCFFICTDADDSVTFRKFTVREIQNVCEWLTKRSPRKISQICKDNKRVRRLCGTTCNLEICEDAED